MRTFQAWNRDLHKYPPVIWDSENDENGPLIDDEFFKMMMFNSYVKLLEGMFFVGEFPDLFLVNIHTVPADSNPYISMRRNILMWKMMGFFGWWLERKCNYPWRIHGAAIDGNIYHYYTPFMLAYIPAPWILWVMNKLQTTSTFLKYLTIPNKSLFFSLNMFEHHASFWGFIYI